MGVRDASHSESVSRKWPAQARVGVDRTGEIYLEQSLAENREAIGHLQSLLCGNDPPPTRGHVVTGLPVKASNESTPPRPPFFSSRLVAASETPVWCTLGKSKTKRVAI